MTMEFSLGRASQKSPARMYQVLEPKKSKWHLHGYVAVVGNYLLMMFYTTVAGWMLRYFFSTAIGDFEGKDATGIKNYFSGMLADEKSMVLFMAIIVIVGFLVCSFGLQKGLERITKWMMIALLALLVGLAVYSCTLSNAGDGLKFYLVPDFDLMKEVGIGTILVAAMNQAFFTLSIGIGSMAIFGSYIDKERSLMGESVNVIILDLFVAITAGLIIFPFPLDTGLIHQCQQLPALLQAQRFIADVLLPESGGKSLPQCQIRTLGDTVAPLLIGIGTKGLGIFHRLIKTLIESVVASCVVSDSLCNQPCLLLWNTLGLIGGLAVSQQIHHEDDHCRDSDKLINPAQ